MCGKVSKKIQKSSKCLSLMPHNFVPVNFIQKIRQYVIEPTTYSYYCENGLDIPQFARVVRSQNTSSLKNQNHY